MRTISFRLRAVLLAVTITAGFALIPLTAGGQEGRPASTPTPQAPSAPVTEPSADATGWDGDGPVPRVLHGADTTIDGSACVGIDCNTDPPSPGYGFNTVRLQENNLRIAARDTSSTPSFPTQDWQIEFNATTNGGANYFMVRDCGATGSTGTDCGGTNVFTIEAGAGNDALYVDSHGDVGINEDSPATELHITDGDSPTARLEQDGSSGFTAQTWDLAGNEANFFIRDVTGGSLLPFRIRPGTPNNTLMLDGDAGGQVGIGLADPTQTLHIRGTDGDTQALVQEASTTTADRTLLSLSNQGQTRIRIDNTVGEAWDLGVVGTSIATSDFVIRDFDTGVEYLNIENDGGDVTIVGDLIRSGSGAYAFPDYVFDATYGLPSFADLREYIASERHLPGVMSAGEVIRAGGINMTELQIQLLEKVEELTLYTLQLETRITELEGN